MQFNNYLWGIYKKSEGYKKSCEYLENFKTIYTYLKRIKNDINNEDINNIKKTYDFFLNKHFDRDDAINIFTSWIKEGVQLGKQSEDNYLLEQNDPLMWCYYISNGGLSDILYILYPDFFFIYEFNRDIDFNFQTFVDICELFEIGLPKIPAKKDKLDRALYYINICDSLLEFRRRYNLTAIDMYAFIYDYAIKILFDYTENNKANNDNEVLPAPTKAWFIGAGVKNGDTEFLSNESNYKKIESWQCSQGMKKGDICVIYALYPISSICSICRVFHKAHIDPFYHFYVTGHITNFINVTNIRFKEIKNNAILSKNSKVRQDLQGINGYPISFEEYNEILRILKEEKNFDTSLLPKIEPIESLDTNIILDDERDVEKYLVEPFLEKLGYSKKDYIRQMPLRMGTGISYYPDYAFFANTQKGEETAKCILETKYHILNSKQLENAFYQAKSYASRLGTKLMIVSASEGIWIFSKDNKNKFSIKNYKNYSWNETSSTDNFHEIINLVGYEKVKKYKFDD